ncbi:MAG: MFS transporter [Anaerolineae bacterium]|nr:MFS transporter [Anaerolineae bacterium]
MTNVAESRKTGHGILIGTACFVSFLLTVPNWISSAVLVDAPSRFTISFMELDTLTFVMGCGYILVCLFAGWLLSRVGAGTLIFIGGLLAGLAALGFALAPTWNVVVGLAIVFGMGSGLIFVVMVTFFATQFSARALIWLFLFRNAYLLPNLLLGAMDIFHWQTGFVIIAIVFAITSVILAVTRTLWNIVWAGDKNKFPVQIGDTLNLPSFWMGAVLFIVAGGLGVIINVHWPILLGTTVRELGLDALKFWTNISQLAPLISLLTVVLLVNHLPIRLLLWANAISIAVGMALMDWGSLSSIQFIGHTLETFGLATLLPLLLLHLRKQIAPVYMPYAIGWLLAASTVGSELASRLLKSELAGTFNLIGPIVLIIIFLAIIELSVRLNAPKKKKAPPTFLPEEI